jgi:hypothetical protein
MKHVPVIALAILVLGSAALAVVPSYLVSPMRSQTQYDMELSHALSNWAPILVVINLVIGAILASMIWRRKNTRLWNKVILAVGVTALAFAAYNTRGYLAEGMFTALPEVVRVAASDATHVLPEDLVLGVKHADGAAAYPFPIIGYHHIVNDRLAGEPYVVTY